MAAPHGATADGGGCGEATGEARAAARDCGVDAMRRALDSTRLSGGDDAEEARQRRVWLAERAARRTAGPWSTKRSITIWSCLKYLQGGRGTLG